MLQTILVDLFELGLVLEDLLLVRRVGGALLVDQRLEVQELGADMHLALDELLALLQLVFVISDPGVLGVETVLLFDLPGPGSQVLDRIPEGMLEGLAFVFVEVGVGKEGEDYLCEGHDESG